MKVVVFFILLIASIINPIQAALANARGTTIVVYISSGQELVSEKPNTLSIENGEVVIILANGTRLIGDKTGLH